MVCRSICWLFLLLVSLCCAGRAASEADSYEVETFETTYKLENGISTKAKPAFDVKIPSWDRIDLYNNFLRARANELARSDQMSFATNSIPFQAGADAQAAVDLKWANTLLAVGGFVALLPWVELPAAATMFALPGLFADLINVQIKLQAIDANGKMHPTGYEVHPGFVAYRAQSLHTLDQDKNLRNGLAGLARSLVGFGAGKIWPGADLVVAGYEIPISVSDQIRARSEGEGGGGSPCFTLRPGDMCMDLSLKGTLGSVAPAPTVQPLSELTQAAPDLSVETMLQSLANQEVREATISESPGRTVIIPHPPLNGSVSPNGSASGSHSLNLPSSVTITGVGQFHFNH